MDPKLWLRLPAACGALVAGTLVAGAAAAPEPGPARLSGALRHALRIERRAAGFGVSALGAARAREVREGLARAFMVDASGPAPRATFKATLATGSAPEVDALRAAGARIRARIGRIVALDAPLADAERLAAAPGLRRLDIAKRMRPELDVSGPEIGADLVRDPAGFGATGSGVLVAGVDTGHDVKHRDFRFADGTTRFKSVLNMDPACRGPHLPAHPDSCYFTESRINKFIKGRVGMDYKDPGGSFGHGSHTLGIAAGNGLATGNGIPPATYVGVAPGADLIGVKVFDAAGRQVGDIIEALQFLMEEQLQLGNPPLVVNLSLGHQFGAHDGTDPDEMAIDAMIQDGIATGATRVVAKSAGNSELDDIFVEGAVSTGAPDTHTFTIPAADFSGTCSPFSGRGNDSFLVGLWYEGDADITVRVTAPGAATFFENRTGNDPNAVALDTSLGTIFVDCPSTPDPENGDRECVFGVDDSGGAAPAAGQWAVRITAHALPSGGEYDAWIALANRGNCGWGWDDPDPGHSISIPGTAFNSITAGAYMTRTDWINVSGRQVGYMDPGLTIGDIAPFSSVGPTRDGRLKPEIAAPGMGIASTKARSVPTGSGSEGRLRTVEDGKHLVLEGTSMASPHVAGAAALLLSMDPTLTAPEIRNLLTQEAAVDLFTGGVPNDAWGFGKLDVFAAAGQVRAAKRGDDPRP
jgi:subtilisin family serine protease